MKKPKRTVNKKLAGALIGHAGSSYQYLADRVDPPVSRPRISQIMNDVAGNERIQSQLADLLLPAFDALVREVLHIDHHNLLDHLFPLVSQDTEAGSQITEEKDHNLHGIEEGSNDQACA